MIGFVLIMVSEKNGLLTLKLKYKFYFCGVISQS